MAGDDLYCFRKISKMVGEAVVQREGLPDRHHQVPWAQVLPDLQGHPDLPGHQVVVVVVAQLVVAGHSNPSLGVVLQGVVVVLVQVEDNPFPEARDENLEVVLASDSFVEGDHVVALHEVLHEAHHVAHHVAHHEAHHVVHHVVHREVHHEAHHVDHHVDHWLVHHEVHREVHHEFQDLGGLVNPQVGLVEPEPSN